MPKKTKALDKSLSGNPDLDIAALYFFTLREEILSKISSQIQLVYYKLLAVGGLLGILLAASGPFVDQVKSYTIILPILVAIGFDLSLYQNNNGIILAGEFIRDEIEAKWFRYLLASPSSDKWIFWEQYIAATHARRSYGWLEGTQYLLTITLTVFSIGTSYFRDPRVAFVLGILLFGEVVILWKGFFRSLRK